MEHDTTRNDTEQHDTTRRGPNKTDYLILVGVFIKAMCTRGARTLTQNLAVDIVWGGLKDMAARYTEYYDPDGGYKADR